MKNKKEKLNVLIKLKKCIDECKFAENIKFMGGNFVEITNKELKLLHELENISVDTKIDFGNDEIIESKSNIDLGFLELTTVEGEKKYYVHCCSAKELNIIIEHFKKYLYFRI